MFKLNFKELCEFFGNSESTVKQKLKRKQEEYAKKGVIVSKEGRGVNAIYTIEIDSNWVGDTPQSISEIRSTLDENGQKYSVCHGCGHYLTGNRNRLVIPSKSGKTELIDYCCDSCLEDLHYYLG